MKVTEQTTLAELDALLAKLGHPFITVMKTHQNARYARQAVAYLPGVGTFNGSGNTHAEAIQDAITGLRDALDRMAVGQGAKGAQKPIVYRPGLPADQQPADSYSTFSEVESALAKQGISNPDWSNESEHDQYDRATGDLGRPILGLCHGCSHPRAEHPNYTGCQEWHDKP